MNKKPDIDDLIARISGRLADLGMTERQVSLAATGRPDAIRYIRTRRHWPSAPRLAELARALQTTPAYLLGAETDPGEPLPQREEFNWVYSKEHDLPWSGGDPEQSDVIPIFATTRQFPLGEVFSDDDWPFANGYILDRMEEVNFCKHPPMLKGRKGLYGIYIPRMDARGNDFYLVEPRRPSGGDEVLIYFSDDIGRMSPEAGEPIAVNRYVRSINGAVEFYRDLQKVPADKIVRIHRILPLREILGA